MQRATLPSTRVRRLAATLMLGLGLAAPAAALDYSEARHLLARTGFGGTPAEIEAYLPLTREEAVDAILAGTHQKPRLAPPAWCDQQLGAAISERDREWDAYNKLPEGPERDKKQNERRQRDRDEGRELKSWWYQEMIATDSPLTERMVLFWSNHFTSQLEVVEHPRLMYEQNALLRQHATGNFAHMVLAIPFDSAMFRYLDSNSNVAWHPNENFAREVMELFTVGEGNYTEVDIKEAARAFSGYKIDHASGKPVLNAGEHDGGKKNVLGHKGTFDANEIITILLLKEENVALNIAGKLWNEFVSETPDTKEIYKIAAAFYKSRYQIKTGLRAVLLHEKFWDPANRGGLIKSPAELLVGSVRQLCVPVNDPTVLVEMGKKLGEDLLDPPNVKGWKGGKGWISTHGLLSRWEVMEDISRGKLADGKGTVYAEAPAMMGGPEMAAGKKGEAKAAKKADTPAIAAPVRKPWVEDAKAKGPEGVDQALATLLPIAPTKEINKAGGIDAAIKQILQDPVYNLK